MCGIAGIINLEKMSIDDSRLQLLEKALELMLHRGPDESGLVNEGQVALGHQRLSIIDLNGGHQPMRSACNKGLICYNGEVYNFRELRDNLKAKGRGFSTDSDTEVVLNAYLEWGNECLKHLRGMFSFAAVDFEKQTVLLARDRLGIKPLVYTVNKNSLIFSSELEPLYKTFGPFKLSLDALDDYLQWQYIQAPKTIYKDVFKLEPGYYIDIDLSSGKFSKQQYWDISFNEDKSLSLSDWETKIDELIRESVKLRLVSDVPFGAFLSGGIDSSLVTGYMAEIMDQPVKTFSIGFEQTDFSELGYAKQAAEINQTNHHTEIVKAESLSLLPLLVKHYGEPFADSSAIPTYYVSKMAAKHVKMVLSGDGGDENFAGYHSYETVLRGLQDNGSIKPPQGASRAKHFMKYFITKLSSISNSANNLDEAYNLHCGTARHFWIDERKALFNSKLSEVCRDLNPERKAFFSNEEAPVLSRLQKLDLKAYLPFDILTKVDIASMANSLETRVPLLDHKLVEAAASIPEEFKLIITKTSEYDKKHILKNIAKKRYPSEMIDRRKMGFGVPLNHWFANELKENVRNLIASDNPIHSILNKDACLDYVNKHSLEYDCSTKLWNLLFLHEWSTQHQEAFE